ncbi:hypothetical protein BH10PSE19_BH10PSE19_01760 [soil metagenome]
MTVGLDDTFSQVNWIKPIPLITEQDSANPYPTHCLPAIIQNAVVAYHRYGQQPLPLITCSALASVSLACQTLANVARDHLLISPISLFFLVVANSGERKSAADQVFSHAIRQWEIAIRDKLTPDLHVSHILHQAWRAEKKGLLSQIQRSALLDPEEVNKLKERLVEVMHNEPMSPLLPALFFEDTTQEALASYLAHGWSSSSLWSDEGGIVIAGHGMQSNMAKFVAFLNRLWDGKSFIAHRKTSKSFMIANRRLTVSLMLQPMILERMLTKNNGISRHSGFLARSLIAYPESAMGERYYQEPPKTLSALLQFQQRITHCLDSSLSLGQKGCHDIPTLLFSNTAKAQWIAFFNHIEAGLKKSQQWVKVKDFASKAAENAARLAALFHVFTGNAGPINTECIEQATTIIQWHLLETRRILDNQPESSQQTDAIRLLQWLKSKQIQQTTPRYLQQYSPIRDKIDRDDAIAILIENHYLQEITLGGKVYLLVNPILFI